LAFHEPGSCSGKLPFAGVFALGFYHSQPLRAMITDLKYRGVTASASDVEGFIRFALSRRSQPLPWEHEDQVVFVPMQLSASRLRERGFNQATWFTRRVMNVVDPHAPMEDALHREDRPIAQASLDDMDARRANVRGAFTVTQRITNPVVLVDDVITTGFTAAEAAQALIRASAPRVYVLTMAIGK
jgi:predicted amidophosphoribosyltransferase